MSLNTMPDLTLKVVYLTVFENTDSYRQLYLSRILVLDAKHFEFKRSTS